MESDKNVKPTYIDTFPSFYLSHGNMAGRTFPKKILLLTSYNVIARKDRALGTHGGTAIITNCSCGFSEIRTKYDFGCAVKLHLSIPFVLICIYNPPVSSNYRVGYCSTIDFLKTVLSKAPDTHFIITGDFNEPNTNWDYSMNNDNVNPFIDFLLKHNFEQHVNIGTRNSGNILDLVFTNFDPQQLLTHNS